MEELNVSFVQPNVQEHLTDRPNMTIAFGWDDKKYDSSIFVLLGKIGGTKHAFPFIK